jgi:ribosomal protein S18 acetylase RimI-like enzyme
MSLDLTGFREKFEVPDTCEIHQLESKDIDALARMEIEAYQDTLDFLLRPELQSFDSCKSFLAGMFAGKIGRGRFLKNLSFKILCNSTLCGAIYTFENGKIVHIADLLIAPYCRRRGLGSALLAYSLHSYKAAGYRQVALAVTATNRTAIQLYKKFGFEIEKSFPVQLKERR